MKGGCHRGGVGREGGNASTSSEKSKKDQKVAKNRGGFGTGYAVCRQNKRPGEGKARVMHAGKELSRMGGTQSWTIS